MTNLALGLAFVAIGIPFLSRAGREEDPAQKRNKRFAGYGFMAAGAAFFLAYAIGALS